MLKINHLRGKYHRKKKEQNQILISVIFQSKATNKK